MSIRVKRTTVYTENDENDNTCRIISESFILGDDSTLPLIFLEGEIQQKEYHRPGLSMGPINILEEDNPQVIKEYLCGFIDFSTIFVNEGAIYSKGESECIDFTSLYSNGNGSNGNGNFCVAEVAVCSPKIIFGSGDDFEIESSQKEEAVFETTVASRVESRPQSAMDDILDEFSYELEKKLNQNGFSSEVPKKGDSPSQTEVWWMKKESKPVVKKQISKGTKPEFTRKKEHSKPGIASKEEHITPELVQKEEHTKPQVVPKEESTEEIPEHQEKEDIKEIKIPIEDDELEETMNGILEIMEELENEKKGTDEERAKLRKMIQDIEDQKEDFKSTVDQTPDDRIELQGLVKAVEEKMNQLKMQKLDSDVAKAEMGGMIAQIEDKMTELELTQIGTEAEGSELKRMMNGIQDKIAEIEDGGIENEVAKAELEGMLAKMEDQMTDFELSQLGSEAEKTQLKRMMEDLEKRIFEIDRKSENTELEEKLKGMEEKMTEMAIQLQGAAEKMEEMQSEIDTKRFTLEYIQNLHDKGELEVLCLEVGLSPEGDVEELRDRLLGFIGDKPKKEEKDLRFTKEGIENVQTKAQLVALCEEAGLKKSGKKEEIRQRLLDYVKEKELSEKKEKQREQRFTREYIENIETKEELEDLCDEEGLIKTGDMDELRKRLLEYAKKRNLDPSLDSSEKGSYKMGAPDKLVYAVLGDMFKHLSMETGDSFSDHVSELEGFIRAILDFRHEYEIGPDEVLKTVVLKPNNERTTEVLKKLKTTFLDKVKADYLEIVDPGEQWEGIKLQMIMNRELIFANFKSQATKIQMLLNMQPPQKIRKILEEKGEYTLGVEGFPVTISSKMLTFNELIPKNFEVREVDAGLLYIENDIVNKIEEEEITPQSDQEIEPALEEEVPEEVMEEEEPPEPVEPEPQEEDVKQPLPPPPPRRKRKKRTKKDKKKGFMGKLRKRWEK